ncbi:MAG: terminase small subunit [Pseudomonadota bacterium]
MPKLKNDQHERFLQELVKGASQKDAYIAAGYKADNEKSVIASASRLLVNDNIKARLAELQGKGAEKAAVTLEWLMEQAKGIMQDAWENGSYAAAVSAVKELGVLSGQRVEKRDTTTRNVTDIADVSRDELLAIASGSRAAEADGRSERSDSVH